MVKLSEFIGAILDGLAAARTHSDYSTAAASEIYHADPFIKNLPVPHYIIDEAEIEVPVTVIGISTQTEDYSSKKQMLIDSLKDNLPSVLLENFKWNYINERIKQSSAKLKNGSAKKEKADAEMTQFSEHMLDIFEKCIQEICNTVTKKFVDNLNLYNYTVLKLLEITESFSAELEHALNDAVKILTNDKQSDVNPFISTDSIGSAIKYVSSIMFFNFKKIMQSDTGIFIDVKTTKMNEYGQKDCFMNIKLKIKEQDLNLITEEKDRKEKRYLSLT